jgi:3-hydroxyacyl-CoA dehydrogenase/enoyl-CoA hydratase/3-hydroxybutyryl-CoA epimerase
VNAGVPDLRYEVRDGIARITFDRPQAKVNVLSVDVLRALAGLLDELQDRIRAGAVAAVVVRSAKPGHFIAGADLDELAAVASAELAAEAAAFGQRTLGRLSRLGVPTLAAINGTCLGGGLELALACTARVAADDDAVQIGFPEVRLGLLPGFGGTTRLPRLLGFSRALDLILTGRSVGARDAFRMGLVDETLPAANFDTWVDRRARDLARGARPWPRPRRRPLGIRVLDGTALGRRLVAQAVRRRVLRETRGHYPAPLRALEVALRGCGMPLERALELEARAVGALLVSPVCKNLLDVFRLTERAKKSRPPAEPRPVRRAAVVGAGVMGAGIAELFAFREIPVRVKDVDEARVADGLRRARRLLERAGRRWPPHVLERRLEMLAGAVTYDGFASADLVVEAVVERMDVKRAVFAELEARVRPDAVLATNTSALSVSELQTGLRHPERVCGMHFFNPAHRMPLVEIVRGQQTDDVTLATAFATAARLGKTPVVVADAPGFLVNRVLGAYLAEAGRCLQDGAPPERLDAALLAFGMPMGPLRLLDEIGLDIAADAQRTLHAAFGERYAPAPVVEQWFATGRLGRKGGAGFYRYRGDRALGCDPALRALLREATTDRAPDDEEIVERTVLAMVNEAARALEDGVVARPDDVDVAMILGTGFPPFRGGLLRYADTLGCDYVVRRLDALADRLGDRFRPAPLLRDLARTGRAFRAAAGAASAGPSPTDPVASGGSG